MKYCMILYWFVGIWRVVYTYIFVRGIEYLPPYGIRFTVSDGGYDLVAFHYSINEPLYNVDPGQWNFDVTEKAGRVWIHENPNANVQVGDTVNYWIYARKTSTGLAEQLQNQSTTLKGNTTNSGEVTTSTSTIALSSSGQKTDILSTTSSATQSSVTSSVTVLSSVSTGSDGRSTPTTGMNTRSTTLSRSGTNDSISLSNFTYLIVFSTLGVIFMVCLTVICICYIRKKSSNRPIGNQKGIGENVRNNLSERALQGQGRDEYNANTSVQNVPLRELQYNTNTAANRNNTSANRFEQDVKSRHIYDAVDENTHATKQYDYTDSSRAAYDLPKDFLNKFEPGNKYDVLARNRDENQDKYQPLQHSYLELA